MIRDTTSEWRGGKNESVRGVVCISRVPRPGRAVLVVWYKEGSRRFRCRLGSPGTRARCIYMLHAGAATAACFCFPAWPRPRFFVFHFLGSPVCRACFSAAARQMLNSFRSSFPLNRDKAANLKFKLSLPAPRSQFEFQICVAAGHKDQFDFQIGEASIEALIIRQETTNLNFKFSLPVGQPRI